MLLKKRLVACVNIIPRVQSFFWWKGKIEEAKEVLLFAKTKRNRIKQIIRLVKNQHSYDCPAILALPIETGYRPFLNWIEHETL